MGITYRDSGVDIEKGEQFVSLIRKKLGNNRSIGLFGGLYEIGSLGYKNPVLVASTDGVGTKLLLAKRARCYSSIGIDLVAMCVNDVIVMGARPLFFLDYMATAELNLAYASEVIDGIIEGCRQAQCVLLGGETAEMPGVYSKGDYELAGFSVGIVEKDKIIDGASISKGDLLVGLPSSGIHSNGLSLARKALFDIAGYEGSERPGGLTRSIIDELLIPTRIYVTQVLDILPLIPIKGIAHITGGGLYSNVKRILPDGLDITIEWGRLAPHKIFSIIQNAGKISDKEMRNTFNMGIGLVFIVLPKYLERLIAVLEKQDEHPIVIGSVIQKS